MPRRAGQADEAAILYAVTFILVFIGSMLALDGLCWWVCARVAKRRGLRWVIGIFIGAQMLGLGWIVMSRVLRTDWAALLPKFALSAVFIWHFIGLGLFVIVCAVCLPALVIKVLVRLVRRKDARTPANQNQVSRREFMRFAAVLAPPIFTISLSGIALAQLNNFRVRRFVIPIRDLPTDLAGTTIAQVSDIHIGRFTSGRVLGRMVEVVNKLDADLVLLTGDLINDALADLNDGLVLVRRMQSRFGSYLIEGNHDLIENGPEFERRVKASAIPFLLDESTIVTVRGSPIQLLGLSWTRARQNRDEAIAISVNRLLQQRQPDVFPILLAHHPHAFDAAVTNQIPLTLSGHTHGGQLMLNEQLGFGPAMFRYWSGHYRRNESQLVVSNGVGNWFPLRIKAPAEIVHITLQPA